MNTSDSSVQEPADYVERMQLSVDLLDASRRVHNANLAVARCQGAIACWPTTLVWRHALAIAVDNRNDALARYSDLIARIRWLEWGMVEEEGP